MLKKTWLYTLLLFPTLAACQPTNLDKVVIPFSDEVRTQQGDYVTLTEYNELSVMIEQDQTFILTVGNGSCGCTTEFLPVMREWIEENKILTYYVEYTKLQFAENKFGIPLVTGSMPVLTIFDRGELAYYQAYNPNRSSDNDLFYDLDLLSDWFEQRLIFPSFQFLTKANFDQLFTNNQKMIIYIGRRTCPDCTYAFNTFVLPYLQANPTLPPIFGIDVLDTQLWNPETGNSTPGWSDFKTNYGMDNILNTTFGYATGFVPTFMYIETNGQSIQTNPLIIKDMIVTYNDSSRNANNEWTNRLTRTFFDGSRPLQYTDLDLTSLIFAEDAKPTTSAALRTILEPYHNEAMLDFFTMYLPQISLAS